MYLQVKKINQSTACTNAERWERVFPPTKDIGTRAGDRLGKGKYFPRVEMWLGKILEKNLATHFLSFNSRTLRILQITHHKKSNSCSSHLKLDTVGPGWTT